MMKTVESALLVALPPSAAAGPIFLLSLLAAQAVSLMPEPIPFGLGAVIVTVFALVPSAIIGFFVSYLPNAMGTHVLSIAGESSETAREPLLWAAVGGLLGLLFAIVFGAYGNSMPLTFALVATSAASAALCRRGARWED